MSEPVCPKCVDLKEELRALKEIAVTLTQQIEKTVNSYRGVMPIEHADDVDRLHKACEKLVQILD